MAEEEGEEQQLTPVDTPTTIVTETKTIGDNSGNNNQDDDNDNDNDDDDKSKGPQRRASQKQAEESESQKTPHDEELIRQALQKSPFFTCLDEEQVRKFTEKAVLKTFARGEIVILEGCVDQEDDDDEEEDDEYSSKEIDFDSALAPADPDDYDDYAFADEYDDNKDDDKENVLGSVGKAVKSVVSSSEASSSDAAAEVDENDEETNAHSSQQDQTPSDETITSSSSAVVSDESSPIDESSDLSHVPAAKSGVKRSIYIVRNGHAAVWYQRPRLNTATLGPGTLFGEGGFLFGRQHSASVVATAKEQEQDANHNNNINNQQQQLEHDNNKQLECWVVDISTFRNEILPASQNLSRLFHKYAKKQDENNGSYYMTMEDFVEATASRKYADDDNKNDDQDETTNDDSNDHNNNMTMQEDPLASLRIANTYNILRSYNSRRTQSTPKIYLDDFCFFHLIMARPDPEVDIAFLLMDQNQTGQIYLEDLDRFLKPAFPDLDFNTHFFQRYFGRTKRDNKEKKNQSASQRSIRQVHFSQFLIDLQREMGKQAFLRMVEQEGTPEGYIAPDAFVQVLKTACGWRLPQGVADRLEQVYCHRNTNQSQENGANTAVDSDESGSDRTDESIPTTSATAIDQSDLDRYFAYGDFLAFQEVLSNLPGICNLIDQAQEIKRGSLSSDDFKLANRVMGFGGRLSRRQVQIVFQLFDLDRDGYVSHKDTVNVCGVDFAQRLVAVEGRGGELTLAPPAAYRHMAGRKDENMLDEFISYMKHFSLTAVAGSIGVMMLYPMDLIKTRLMNQRINILDKKRIYRSSLDCLQQALRIEGFAGLYRGVTPQLLGVAPEKAIKLQVNDLIRMAFSSDEDSEHPGRRPKLKLWLEVLAGACAGACQLLVTNPMEITKIRLQMQGETAQMMKAKGQRPPTPLLFQDVVRELGFPGVYRGASACLMRDIPFSAIYFPAYAALKEMVVERNSSTGKVRPSDLLLAGTLAGVPAALLTTPADVIKTRLQVEIRPGETTYTGIRDCATKIYHQEGLPAFFQGSAMRVMRIAPQFGISLLAYETMSQWLGFRQKASYLPPTNVPLDPRDVHTAFPATRFIQPKTEDIDGWMRTFGVNRSPRKGWDESS